MYIFSVQSLSCVQLFVTPWTAACQASFSSVQFSRSVVPTLCDPMNRSTPSLPVHHQLPEFTQTHVHHQWCHPAISSSVIPFSSCLQSYSVSESFPVIQLLASGGQSTGASASASVLPMNIQGWFPFDWFDHFIVQKTQHTFIDRQIHRSVSAIDLKYFQWCITFYFKGRVITMCQVLSLSV